MADVLTFEAEHRALLANLQFGGRAGRTTTDSLHLLNSTVKEALRRGEVASVVFLDIKPAFPAASPERQLTHARYVNWLRAHQGRGTQDATQVRRLHYRPLRHPERD